MNDPENRADSASGIEYAIDDLPKLSIHFGTTFRSITPFEWDDIPNFAVITGVNGTGKSQLLELFNQTIRNDPRDTERVGFSRNDIEPHEVIYLSGEWQLDRVGETTIANLTQELNDHYQKLKAKVNHGEIKRSQPRLHAALMKVIEETGKEPEEVTFNEFKERFPEIYFEHHNQLSQKIGEVFVKYRLDEIDLLAEGKSREEIIEDIKEPPWVTMRSILDIAKLPFDINDPSTNKIPDPFVLELTDRTSNMKVPFNLLSSGEKVLMSLVFHLYSSRAKNVFPKLFLLDEPDAHLHPSMSRVFIDIMNKVLVDEFRVQVIMTTHSPSTVALSPEESLFVASKTGNRIQKTTKDAALKLLTAGVPSFSVNYENRRQVFVESKNDVGYYEGIYRRILEYLEPEVSLTFISSGEVYTGSDGLPSSNSAQVENATNVLRVAGNNFVFGLIDRDEDNQGSAFVKVLGTGSRYSIENYLCDPILVAYLLWREKKISNVELGLSKERKHLDILTCDDVELQLIAKHIIDRVRSIIGPTTETMKQVSYLSGRSVQIPDWYLDYHGHGLEDQLVAAFPQLGAIKSNKENGLKNAIIEIVIDDFPELTPVDIAETFKLLQSV